jgi:hypothetical protein
MISIDPPQRVLDKFGEFMNTDQGAAILSEYERWRPSVSGRIIGLVLEKEDAGQVFTEESLLNILEPQYSDSLSEIPDVSGTLVCVYIEECGEHWAVYLALPEEDFGWMSPGGDA